MEGHEEQKSRAESTGDEANNKHQTQTHKSPHKPTGNTATRTPNYTMVSDDRLREDVRRTGRVRKQQRILQQAGRNAEAQ
jgi:hypothetical protein